MARGLHRNYKKMILDFAGICSARNIPKKAADLDAMLLAFKTSQPEEYKAAYDVIVLRKLPSNADNTTVVAAKVSEIIESNVHMQESAVVKNIGDAFEKRASVLGEEIKLEARKEIDKARNEFVTYQVKVNNKKPKKVKGTMPKQFRRLVQLGAQRKNTLMVGPAGCGKTFIAKKIAEGLDLEFMSQSCSEGVSESAFAGRLLPMGKNGTFVYVRSQFVRMYEEGGVFLLDEIDGSDPNVLVFLNQALSGDGFTLDIRESDPWVQRHPDFHCIAAANTYGNGGDAQYVGRNQLDAATLDRFKIGTVAMDYDENVERAIVQARSEEVFAWGKKIRAGIEHHSLRRIMSTRVMVDACDMVQGQEWGLKEIAGAYFADWSREEMRVIETYTREAA